MQKYLTTNTLFGISNTFQKNTFHFQDILLITIIGKRKKRPSYVVC